MTGVSGLSGVFCVFCWTTFPKIYMFCWTIFSETYVLLVIEGLSLKSIGTTQLMCLGIIEVQTIVS